MTDPPTPTAPLDGEGVIDAWLDEIEGYGTRRERLVETLENGLDIKPWLVAAYRLAASPGQRTAEARLAKAVAGLEKVRGEAYAWTPSKAAHALGTIAHETLADLKAGEGE